MPFDGLNVHDFGAPTDGVSPASDAFQAMFDASRTGNFPPMCAPAGRYVFDKPVTWYGGNAQRFSPGPRLRGDSRNTTTIVNAITAGGSCFDQRGYGGAKYLTDGEISNLGFEEQGSGPNSHAIQYLGSWHQDFKKLKFSGLNGCGLRALNSSHPAMSDDDASAHVTMERLRAEGLRGAVWSSEGAAGGITLHRLRNSYFINNGLDGKGQIIIDGAIHFEAEMNSIAAFNGVDTPLVNVMRSHIHSQDISFRKGEFGNNSGTAFKLAGFVGFSTEDIRMVRRSGEMMPKIGFDCWDTAGSYIGAHIEANVAIDTATPVYTWLRMASVYARKFVAKPVTCSFAAGNVLYGIPPALTAGGSLKLYNFDGAEQIVR